MVSSSFKPGQLWLDSGGNPIQAHGGGILYSQGLYYWFGENKAGQTFLGDRPEHYQVAVIGVSCYSSRDLYNWDYQGVVLPAEPDDPTSDLHRTKVVERPKVIYNSHTGKYVMWMHIDTTDYAYARAGVAISDTPTGPYHYLGSFRPNGAMSRDMSLFQDEDGTAYHIFSSEDNRTLHISLLEDDYLAPSGQFVRLFEGRYREAPAMCKFKDRYYLVSSGCTGWDPNAAEYAMAPSALGPWTTITNPCRGAGSEQTFGAQSTFILPVAGKPGKCIFMADIWNKYNLSDSRYVWLPIRFEGDRMVIEWLDEWNLDML